jgi:hypothetical protein
LWLRNRQERARVARREEPRPRSIAYPRIWAMRRHPDVGDRVQVRSDGGSAAARKYAGKKGCVTMRGPGLDRILADVQLEENNFDMVFDEEDQGPIVFRDSK